VAGKIKEKGKEEPCPRCSGWLSPGFTCIQASSYPIVQVEEIKGNGNKMIASFV